MGTSEVMGIEATRNMMYFKYETICTECTFRAAKVKMYHTPDSISHEILNDAVSYMSLVDDIRGIESLIFEEISVRNEPCDGSAKMMSNAKYLV